MSQSSRTSIRLFSSLLLFGIAIASLWIGLTTNPVIVRISGWYIGAVVLAILAVIILVFPTTKEEKSKNDQARDR